MAQEKADKTFIITDKGSETDVTPYIVALEKADFSCHRIRNKRRVLEFKTGVKVELLSAEEMLRRGVTPKTGCLSPESVLQSKQPVYVLLKNGMIGEVTEAPEQPKTVTKKQDK